MPALPNYKTIPGQDELGTVERDLRFHPSPVTDPRTLTREQVQAFNEQGYLKGLPDITAEEMVDLRAYFDALLERTLAAGGNSYSISTAHLKYGRAYDLLTSPRIVAYVRDLLGDDVIAWGSHFFCKMPHDGKVVHWHQDASYWPLTPSKTDTNRQTNDDADNENASMRFIPGSHHYGHLTYRLTEDDPNAVLNQEVENAEQFGAPVDVELKSGQISIHSDLLLHGSAANESDRRRCGLTLRYCAAEVRAGLEWNLKGTVVSGSDPEGHWGNPPRPEVE